MIEMDRGMLRRVASRPAELLGWLHGFSLVVLGLVNIVRAFRYGTDHAQEVQA